MKVLRLLWKILDFYAVSVKVSFQINFSKNLIGIFSKKLKFSPVLRGLRLTSPIYTKYYMICLGPGHSPPSLKKKLKWQWENLGKYQKDSSASERYAPEPPLRIEFAIILINSSNRCKKLHFLKNWLNFGKCMWNISINFFKMFLAPGEGALPAPERLL